MHHLQEISTSSRNTEDGTTTTSSSQSITTILRDRYQLCRSLHPQAWTHQEACPLKAYIVLFVCFATKAVHLEIVSDLTTEAFLAALRRFVYQRGLPTEIHSDNGTNFVGAWNDLADLYRFLSSDTTSSSIHSYLLTNRISWYCIPERAPHFGGLWEAAVKSTKFHLR